MDLSLSSELRLLQDTVRRFIADELAPLERAVDEADDVEPEALLRLRRRAAELGLTGFNIPHELGGGGVGPLGEVVIGEEVGRTSIPLAETVGRVPQALVYADGEQRRWLLEPILRADKTACVALTEPDAGSDLSGLQTSATRHGDGWRIHGSKVFISNAETSDYILLLCVTDRAAPLKQRFTMFALDRYQPGMCVTQRFRKMGWRGYHIGGLSLEDCEVGEERVLGDVGGGFKAVMASVNSMRLYIAARCVGAAQLLLGYAVEHAKNRETFGRRLGEHGAIQVMLADMDVEIAAARGLVLAAAWQAEIGSPDARIAAARAKLYASEMAGRVADATLQIYGGAGFMSDLPIERMYRDLRAFRIGEGTSEMQRIQIARRLLAG